MDLATLLLLNSMQGKNYTPADPTEAEAQNAFLNLQNAQAVQPMTTQAPITAPAPGPNAGLMPQTMSSVTQVRGPISDKDRYDSLLEQYNSKVQDGLSGQEQGILQLERFRNEAARSPTQIDISPLNSYIDSIVEGSKLSQGYKAPESGAEKQHRLMGYEDAIQKARLGLSDKEIDAMKAALQNSLYSKALQSQGRQERFAASQELKKEDKIRTDLNKEIADPMMEDLQKFDSLEANFSKGDYASVVASLANFSRAVAGQKGVLTDKDIVLTLPSNFQGSLAKFQAYFANTPTAAIDPAYTKSLMDLTALAKQKAGEKYNNTLRSREKQYGARGSQYESTMQGPGREMFGDLKGQIDTYFGKKPSAQTKNIGGVTYVKNPQTGKWDPQ